MDYKKILPNINRYIKDETECITSNEKSHEGLSVPEIVMKYAGIKNKIDNLSVMGKPLVKTIFQAKKSYRAINTQPNNTKIKISDKDLSDLQSFAKTLGIDKIGFTQVDESYIFKDKKILYKNAIVLLKEMKKDKIVLAPSKENSKEIFRTYYVLGVIVNKIAEYLKSKGYNAQANPALGGDVNYPLLAQKAGLGAIGKHGLLITSEFGPSQRIAAVYTNIENLPTAHEINEHLWIKEYCDICNRCVKFCPAQAIYKDTIIFKDETEQHIDYKKCALPFVNDRQCTVCVKECNFFRKEYKSIKKGFTSRDY